MEKRSYSRISGQTSLDSVIARPGSAAARTSRACVLVRGIDVAVQEADRHASMRSRAQRVGQRRDRAVVELQPHLAARIHPFRHAEAQVARHQRLRPLHVEVVLLEAVLVRHLDAVAETLAL